MSEIFEGQNNGQIVVTGRSTGGTQFVDHSADGGIVPENPLVRESQRTRDRFTRRVTGTQASGQPCVCAMPTTRRGNASKVCVNCGGTITT